MTAYNNSAERSYNGHLDLALEAMVMVQVSCNVKRSCENSEVTRKLPSKHKHVRITVRTTSHSMQLLISILNTLSPVGERGR